MITRPLDLAARLRPEPRNFDALFLVNGGLIVLYFFLFGSSFVLAPGVGVDFRVPRIAGAEAGAVPVTHRITVNRAGLIFIGDGPAEIPRLRSWLKAEAKKTRQPTLLVIADAGVPMDKLAEIFSAAHEAGFAVQLPAEEPSARPAGGN